MKTKIKTALAIITACLLQTIQANNYVWIHGLTDNETCWTVYQQAFTASNGLRVGYSSEQSISQAATRTWNNTNAEQTGPDDRKFNHDTEPSYILSNKNDMILIGHSMGGLVARDLQYQFGNERGDNNAPRIKGIITLGTPHEGAGIENSINNGRLSSLITSLSQKLIVSSAYSLAVALPFAPKWFFLGGSTTQALTWLGVNSYLIWFSDLGKKDCEKDMQVNSPYQRTIASRKVTVPILCLAAEEDRWALARLWSSTSSVKNSMKEDKNINLDGKYDMKGIDRLNTLLYASYSFAAIHAGYAISYGLGWWNPYSLAMAGVHVGGAFNWLYLANYVNNGLDFDHASLIGATHVDRILTQHKVWFAKWTTVSYITVPEPHDGVVPVKSQYMATYKGTDVIIPSATIKGANHCEEYNHPNTNIVFKQEIISGGYRPKVFMN